MHVHAYGHIYIYMCVCVFVCMFVRMCAYSNMRERLSAAHEYLLYTQLLELPSSLSLGIKP